VLVGAPLGRRVRRMTPDDRRGRRLFAWCAGAGCLAVAGPPLLAAVAGLCVRLFRWAAWG
jgi:hypothetical protein